RHQQNRIQPKFATPAHKTPELPDKTHAALVYNRSARRQRRWDTRGMVARTLTPTKSSTSRTPRTRRFESSRNNARPTLTTRLPSRDATAIVNRLGLLGSRGATACDTSRISGVW